MAVDEALLQTVASLGTVVLRFYAWSEPAATFGFSQRYAEVATWTALRPLVRRPTGGGLVPHDWDWTYSLAVPPAHPWYRLRAKTSYEQLHAWMRDAFLGLRCNVELAAASETKDAGRCFLRAEEADLVWRGSKIAGAAQRRNRQGLLIQGSVQPPRGPFPDRAAWEEAVLDQACRRWNVRWQSLSPSAELWDRAARLADEKYSQPDHNTRR